MSLETPACADDIRRSLASVLGAHAEATSLDRGRASLASGGV